MKQTFLFTALIVAVALTACTNAPKQTSETPQAAPVDTTPTMHAMIPTTACYAAIVNKDSFELKLEKFPNVVTGTLSYHFHEKDSNKGTIDGTLSGDTLVADYTFMSEGKQSVRQVAFLVKDSMVTEGYGPMEEKSGKMVFKDLSKIAFATGTKMLIVDCPSE